MAKKKIIIAMCIAILFMIVGYSLLSTNLNIKGTSNLTDTWGIKISEVTSTATGRAYNIDEPFYNDTNMTFNVGVKEPGDKMVFNVTVTNYGTLDAILEKIDATTSGSQLIIYSITGIEEQSRLKAGASLTFQVTTEFDINATRLPQSNKTLNIKLSYIQDDGQTLTPSNPSITDNTLLVKEILANNTPRPDTNIDFSQISSDTNGKGLYYTSTNTEDNKTTYYFRGAVENNYVSFGEMGTCNYQGVNTVVLASNFDLVNIISKAACESTNVCALYNDNNELNRSVVGITEEECHNPKIGGVWTNDKATYTKSGLIPWRIVRINEDGSIRIILQDSIGNGAFNENIDDNAYVGYMYGTPASTTYEATHANTNSSTIKTLIDAWYQNTLISYSDYLADSGFCGDRSIIDGLGYGKNDTVYGTIARLFPNFSENSKINPQFKCPQTNDLYTTKTSIKGNKALIYPIGLISADEVYYAGGTYDKQNKNYYLVNINTFDFMTMSSIGFASNVDTWYVRKDGTVYYVKAFLADEMRPVINLKSTVEITGGDGTKNNPYVIKTN